MKNIKILTAILMFVFIMNIGFASMNTNEVNENGPNNDQLMVQPVMGNNPMDQNSNKPEPKDMNNFDSNKPMPILDINGVPQKERVQNMNEMRKQYQEMFVNAVHDNNEQLKEEMRQMRAEVTNMVQNRLKDNNEINYEDFKEFGTKLEIRQNGISVDGNTNTSQYKNSIKVMMNNRNMEISNNQNRIQIRDGNVLVESKQNITLDENGMYVSGKKLEVAPSRIQNQFRDANNFQLNIDQNRLMYQFEIKNQRNLFGIIPMETMEQISLNAENGKVENVSQPWWAFLSTSQNNLAVGQTIE
ncbi:MAG: hypothetical protein PHQ98_01175 [Candidatus ainarchaeum sp.]|nr:hypothetical protein [Candidatus ainarchaeum sp.]